jgi:hypothetical protein
MDATDAETHVQDLFGRTSWWSGRCSPRSARGRRVLLVDELDRADDEFEAFLLEVLSEFAVTIPEIGPIAAETPPAVIVTSNRTRELHDALKRRCLYHWIDHPDLEREIQIVRRARAARERRAGARRGRTPSCGCGRWTWRSSRASPRRSTGRTRSRSWGGRLGPRRSRPTRWARGEGSRRSTAGRDAPRASSWSKATADR